MNTHTLVLTGAESTGKTTLARDVATHFGVPWVPEYARTYLAVHGPGYAEHDVEAIARGQARAEDEARETHDGLLVVDTDLLVIYVWIRERYGRVPRWIDAALEARDGRTYVLAAPDVPWEADPLREHPYARARLHAIYREELQRRRLHWFEVSGARAARVDAVLRHLGAKPPARPQQESKP